MARTLTSYLADLPEAELRTMLAGVTDARERLSQEDEGFAVEERLIKDALAKKGRRTPASSRSAAAGNSRISREQVLRALARLDGPFKPIEGIETVRADYPKASSKAIRAHLDRLVESGSLTRVASGYLVMGMTGAVPFRRRSAFDRSDIADQTSANGQHPAAEEPERQGREVGSQQGAG